jgi:hypothetical protein
MASVSSLTSCSKKVSRTRSCAVVVVYATLSVCPISTTGPAPANSMPIAWMRCEAPSALRFSTKCMMDGVWMPVCGKPPSHG